MSRCHDTLLLLGLWICACHAFSPSVLRPAIGIARGGQGQTGPRPVIAPQGTAQLLVAPRAAPPAMGLFGLGWPEIAVVGTLALLFFGPEKLAPLAKDIGKSASGLKEVSQSFAEGMQVHGSHSRCCVLQHNTSVYPVTSTPQQQPSALHRRETPTPRC
jgi:hypothetical protein